METITNLLVLKDSSKQIAHQTKNGQYAIDHENIANHATQVNRFLENNNDWGLVIVCSAARKLLGYDAWHDVLQTWDTNFENLSEEYQLTEQSLATTGLRHLFASVKQGKVVFVNGHDEYLQENSRHRDNDYVAADIVKVAVESDLFAEVELGMFTNVGGMLDGDSVIDVVEDITAVRHLAYLAYDTGTTGGMASKLHAAEEALTHGATKVWLTDGRAQDALARSRAGGIGTTFIKITEELA